MQEREVHLIMNNSYYGLSCNPFDKHSILPKQAFISEDHKEAVAALDFLQETRGIGVLTASPGMGKSFALRCFEKSLNQNLVQMRYICLSTVSVAEFYKQFCECLGLDIRGGKTVMFKAIQEQLISAYRTKRCPFIIAIDEAQYLSAGILKDIKMLMNTEYDSVNFFTLILCGEPYLNNTLEKPIHEALKQRIMVHYNFHGLKPEEIRRYILHKVSLAGGAESIIGADAMTALINSCQGNPRVIDNVMSNALILGEQLEKAVIDAEVIRAAINMQSLT